MTNEELQQENEALKKRIGELKKLVWFESYVKSTVAENAAYWRGTPDHEVMDRAQKDVDLAIGEAMKALGQASTGNFDYAVEKSEEKLNWARGKIWK